MPFRRSRFSDVVSRQLDLFVEEHAELVRECEELLARYDAAGRDEAEQLYGDYVDAVETGTEALADMRDAYARTLAPADAEQYEAVFQRAVEKRLRPFALELGDR